MIHHTHTHTHACSRDEVTPGHVLLAGGTAGVVLWTYAIAPDTLKSRYQTGNGYFIYIPLLPLSTQF